MKRFLNLPEEKQNIIIDAALSAFAKNGYKKTSVNDIATAAGISKAMIFYYFESKKSMYFYLVNLCTKTLFNMMNSKLDPNVTDFFDRIKMSVEIKMSLIEEHPSLFSFLTSMFYETADEIIEDKKTFQAESLKIRYDMVFKNVDTTKFKDDINPEIILKFLSLASEGFANGLKATDLKEINAFVDDFYKYIDIMKKNLYK